MESGINSTEYAQPWVSEPNTRGTWSILYSCIFTLTLCVYTAIHLNIPPPLESGYKQWLRKTKWVFIAIFAPEMALYSAWQQNYLARRMKGEMQNICRQQMGFPTKDPTTRWEKTVDGCRWCRDVFADPSKLKNKSPPKKGSQTHSVNREYDKKRDPDEVQDFSMTYAHYALMGGFVINVREFYDDMNLRPDNQQEKPGIVKRALDHATCCVDDLTKKWFKKKTHETQKTTDECADSNKPRENPLYVTITPRGVVEFAKQVPWEDFQAQFGINKRSIKDKSKADVLAKMLVLFQVFWALFNSISRVVLGYPISVLEIHTLVHAACALCMYVLWWKKPLDIRDPTYINIEAFKDPQALREKLALMLVRSSGSAYSPFNNFKLPDQWQQFSDSQEPHNFLDADTWPNKDCGSEAAFLCFDASKAALRTYQPNGDETTDDQTYTIFQNKAESRKEGDEDLVLPLVSDAIGTRYDDQVDLEAEIGRLLPPPRTITHVSQPASIERRPFPIADPVRTLSTGHLLPSGIGPSALVTKRDKTTWYRWWDVCYEFADTVLRSTFARRFVQSHRLAEKSVVDVDERLKWVIRLPYEVTNFNVQKGGRYTVGMNDMVYHKVTMHISEKDVLRWNLAAEAFRAELDTSNLPGFIPPEKTASDKEKSKDQETEDGSSHETVSGSQSKPTIGATDNEGTDSEKIEVPGSDANVNETTSTDVSGMEQATTVDRTVHKESPSKIRTNSRSSETDENLKDDIDLSESTTDDKNPPLDNNKLIPGVNEYMTAGIQHDFDAHPQLVPLQVIPGRTGGAASFSSSTFCSRSPNFDLDALTRLNHTMSNSDNSAGGYLGLALYVAMSITSGIYAGVHLALWNHDFPTRAEAIMWKACATALGIPAAVIALFAAFFGALWIPLLTGLAVFAPPVLLIHAVHELLCKSTTYCKIEQGIIDGLTALIKALRPAFLAFGKLLATVFGFLITCLIKPVEKLIGLLEAKFYESKIVKYSWYALFWGILGPPIGALAVAGAGVLIGIYAAVGGAILLYVYARVYIVVESFLSLRHVPVGVYQEVSWSQYVPHL